MTILRTGVMVLQAVSQVPKYFGLNIFYRHLKICMYLSIGPTDQVFSQKFLAVKQILGKKCLL